MEPGSPVFLSLCAALLPYDARLEPEGRPRSCDSRLPSNERHFTYPAESSSGLRAALKSRAAKLITGQATTANNPLSGPSPGKSNLAFNLRPKVRRETMRVDSYANLPVRRTWEKFLNREIGDRKFRTPGLVLLPPPGQETLHPTSEERL